MRKQVLHEVKYFDVKYESFIPNDACMFGRRSYRQHAMAIGNEIANCIENFRW